MIKRTWAYGTRRRGKVLSNEHLRRHPVQLVEDDVGEAHILVGTGAVDLTAGVGDTGDLVFTEGGPTGGYWRFVRQEAVRDG